MDEQELLSIEHLKKYFPVKGVKGVGIRAVDDVSLCIRRGETLGIVGESGCGKTTLGRTILRLEEPTSGKIIYGGKTIFDSDPTKKASADMSPYRRKMQIIFQDPCASLDPYMTAGEIIGEAIDIHKLAANRMERAEMIKALFSRVGLSAGHIDRRPHEFSTGQQQRIGIARALAVNPEFIICDEPVSALDVSIRSQIINLLVDMQRDLGLTYLFISHDISVIRHVSNRIGVMYLGSVVELGESRDLSINPLHPYTRLLLSSVPTPDPAARRAKTCIITNGEAVDPINPPRGCKFHTRCPFAEDACMEEIPKLKKHEKGHWAACHLLEKNL